MNVTDKLIHWLEKEIKRCEVKIDKGGPFRSLEAEKEAYERVLETVRNTEGGRG